MSRGASSASGWTPTMKRSPALLISLAPSPRKRLGGERRRVAADVEHGRVELDEFGVGDHRAGARRHADASPFGLGRVGGDGVEMADAAGGEHDGARRESAAPARRCAGGRRCRSPAGPWSSGARRHSPRPGGSTASCAPRRPARAMIAAPAMSPLTWTTRRSECAASRDMARWPARSRSNGTP